jgi:2-polyprenyl-3-methyl-5-hydroxy-6-metoxy-1,4-benzoquinol methylase
MKPDKCSFCKGKLYEGKTEFVAKMRDEVISIKSCPVCKSCNIMLEFHRQKIDKQQDIQTSEMQLSLCDDCGFVFQNPILPVMQNVDHYVNNANYTLEPTKEMINAKRNQFKWISQTMHDLGFDTVVTTQNIQIGLFDIGAAVGSLLSLAKNAGWNTGGVEPAPNAVAYAKNNYGISLQQGELKEVKSIREPAVLMSHVLEHIPEPVAVLKHILEITDKFCMLFIELPDFSLPRNAIGCGFFVPEHVNYFTPENLTRCAREAGWEVISISVQQYKDANEFCAYPVLRGSFVKRNKAFLRAYRRQALDLVNIGLDAQSNMLRSKISKFLNKVEQVVIFGGGGHTAMLLEIMNDNQRRKIEVILDSNPEREGNNLKGIPIVSSKNLLKYRGRGIIVSSQGYQSQIVEQIQGTVGNSCPILTFY